MAKSSHYIVKRLRMLQDSTGVILNIHYFHFHVYPKRPVGTRMSKTYASKGDLVSAGTMQPVCARCETGLYI